jgi:hypothetical protein
VYWYVSVPAITGSSKGGRIPQNLQRRFRFVQQVESQLVVRSSPYDAHELMFSHKQPLAWVGFDFHITEACLS